MRITCVAAALALLFSSAPAGGQTFDGPSSRAQGMGAFVAVADDAAAVYWNPGALAAGAYFSLVLDRTSAETPDAAEVRGADRSSWFVALSTPALGVSYYRLRDVVFRPDDSPVNGVLRPELSRVDLLVTHHTGVTLVQSLADGVAVGATAKLVRGTAGGASAPHAEVPALVDGIELLGRASTEADVDAGVLFTGALARVGLTVRNLLEPEFETPDGARLGLRRHARAGAALLLTQAWTAALDVDLTKSDGPIGEYRELALGVEGRIARRAVARAGVRINTTGDDRQPSASVGASYAVFSGLLVDAHFRTGSERSLGGWGIAGRVAF